MPPKNSAQGHTAKIAAVVILDAPVKPGEDLQQEAHTTFFFLKTKFFPMEISVCV